MTAPQQPSHPGGAYAPGGAGYPAPPGQGVPPGYGPEPGYGGHAGPAGYGQPPRHTAPDQAPAGRHEDISEVSVGELIGDVTRDLSTLMRQELALAQAEIKQEVSKTATGAGAFGGAAVAGWMTLLFLSVALWWALSHLVGHSWSALIVAVLWGVVGAVLFATGRSKLRQVNPTPERTVDTLKNVPDALKGQRGGTR
ncbi:MAG TPA: phage holin family protein [Pseudonocardia sp.]|nr:phage holin family protein [Pseudonocardia sp.]